MAFSLGTSCLVAEFVPIPVLIHVTDLGVLKIYPSTIDLKNYAYNILLPHNFILFIFC